VEYEGSDTDHLADVLREASLCLLIENETIIAQVFAKTANPLVRFEAGRAIDRIMKWRYPAELYMEKLV